MGEIIDIITFAENYFTNVNLKCVGGESHFEEEFEV
jgi:hypothetical protein